VLKLTVFVVIAINGCQMSSLPQASYYLLYKKDKEIQQQSVFEINSSQTKQSESPTPTNEEGNDDKNTSGNRSFWQEFEWTQTERRNANEALSQKIFMGDIVENNAVGRGQYLIDKYEKEAGSNWDKFYKSHQTNFFKDRHYLEKAFPDEFGVVYGKYGSAEALSVVDGGDGEQCEHFTIVEIGCGVGNTVLPLLELDPYINVDKMDIAEPPNPEKRRRVSVWGLDFSKVAVDLLQKDERYMKAHAEKRAKSAVWDITKTHPGHISTELDNSSDISLLLFCLSAVSPERMSQAANHVAATLKPGGTLILRDYGRFDEAQMKLGSGRGKRLTENFYVKHDSTRVYFFDLDDLESLFGSDGAGLETIDIRYIQRVYTNRSENSERRRVWVQARFRKPLT